MIRLAAGFAFALAFETAAAPAKDGAIVIPFSLTRPSDPLPLPGPIADAGDGSVWIGVRSGETLYHVTRDRAVTTLGLSTEMNGAMLHDVTSLGSGRVGVTEFFPMQAPGEAEQTFFVIGRRGDVRKVEVRPPLTGADEIAAAGAGSIWVLDGSAHDAPDASKPPDAWIGRISYDGTTLEAHALAWGRQHQLVSCKGRPWWFQQRSGTAAAGNVPGEEIATIVDRAIVVHGLGSDDAGAPTCVGDRVVFFDRRLTIGGIVAGTIRLQPLANANVQGQPISTDDGTIWTTGARGTFRSLGIGKPFVREGDSLGENEASTCFGGALCDVEVGDSKTTLHIIGRP